MYLITLSIYGYMYEMNITQIFSLIVFGSFIFYFMGFLAIKIGSFFPKNNFFKVLSLIISIFLILKGIDALSFFISVVDCAGVVNTPQPTNTEIGSATRIGAEIGGIYSLAKLFASFSAKTAGPTKIVCGSIGAGLGITGVAMGRISDYSTAHQNTPASGSTSSLNPNSVFESFDNYLDLYLSSLDNTGIIQSMISLIVFTIILTFICFVFYSILLVLYFKGPEFAKRYDFFKYRVIKHLFTTSIFNNLIIFLILHISGYLTSLYGLYKLYQFF